jgi:hypothetical protein
MSKSLPALARRLMLRGKVNLLIRHYLQTLVGRDDPDRSMEEFRWLSGEGNSRGWRFKSR